MLDGARRDQHTQSAGERAPRGPVPGGEGREARPDGPAHRLPPPGSGRMPL